MGGPDCGERCHDLLSVGGFGMSGHGYYLDAGHYDPNWFAISALGFVALFVLVVMIVDKLFSEDHRIVHRFNKLKLERLVWEDLRKDIPTRVRELEGQ